VRGSSALGYDSDNVRNLSLAGLQPPTQLSCRPRRLTPRYLELAFKFLDEGGNQRRLQKLLLEPGQDARFDGLSVNPAGIIAGAAAPMSRAGEPAVTLRNIRGITDTAAEETGEEVLLAVRAVESNSLRVSPHREGERILPRFDPLPQIVRDDTQMRHFHYLPPALRVRAGDPLAGLRVLDVATAVPLEPADIERVIEYPSAALSLTSDRRVAPRAPPGASNALDVQALGDLARGLQPAANSAKMRRTTAASASLIRRSPAPLLPLASIITS
jgi:hypothetical protein